MKRHQRLAATLLLGGVLVGGAAFLEGCPSEVDDTIASAQKAITKTVPRVGISAEIALLRGQIELYRRLHDRKNPPSLQAMDTLPHLKYEADYSYDPANGIVSSKSFPSL